MKTISKLLSSIALLALTSCNPAIVDKSAVRSAVDRQMTAYPESRLQDLYKSFFQDRFGPGHLIKNRESALNYVLSEMEEVGSSDTPYTDTCGWEGNYIRVNLSAVRDSLISAERLVDAMMASAKDITEEDIQRWKAEWKEIEAIIKKSHPSLPRFPEDKARIDSLLDCGQYAYHHSAEYNRAYHPHYRIVLKSVFDNTVKVQ